MLCGDGQCKILSRISGFRCSEWTSYFIPAVKWCFPVSERDSSWFVLYYNLSLTSQLCVWIIFSTHFYYQYLHLLHTFNYSTYTNVRCYCVDYESNRSEASYFPNITRIILLSVKLSWLGGRYIGENAVILRVQYHRAYLNVTFIFVQLRI